MQTERPFTIDDLLFDEGSKTFVLQSMLKPFFEIAPKKVPFVLKLPVTKILALRDKLIYDPFGLCFKNTKPYQFLAEINYQQLISLNAATDIDRNKIKLNEMQKICCFIYHEIVLPNMNNSFNKKNKSDDMEKFKWGVLKGSENSYVEETDILTILAKQFPNNNTNFFRACIKELVRIGTLIVQYVDANERIVRNGDVQYPITRSTNSVWPKAYVMTVAAYVSTAIIAKFLKGVAIRDAKLEPSEFNLKSKEELKIDEFQHSIISWAKDNPITLITGPAGSGKTRTLKAYVKCLDPSKVVAATLMARTGSALTRDGLVADTIHHYIAKHLKWLDQNDGSDHPLANVETVIIDEGTLPPQTVFAFFFYMLYVYTKVRKVIIGGHEWQLPSVEYGAVFTDMIKALQECTFRMTKYYRSQSKSIYENANAIYNFHTTLKASNVITRTEMHKKQVLQRYYGKWDEFEYDDTEDGGAYAPDAPSVGKLAHREIVDGPDLQERECLDLKEDDQFVFEIPKRWSEPGKKVDFVLESMLKETVPVYMTCCDDDVIEDATTEVSKVNLFRICFAKVLDKSHILGLRNEDADEINKGIHDRIFASGYMAGVSGPPDIFWRGYMTKCGIDKPKYDKEMTDIRKGKLKTNNAFSAIMTETRKSEISMRLKLGLNAVFKGEKICSTVNIRNNNIRNGEILKVLAFKDIALEDLEKYVTISGKSDDDSSSDSESDIGESDFDEDDEELLRDPFSKFGHSNTPKLIAHQDPNMAPIHCFDCIQHKIRTALVKVGGKSIKVDVYNVVAPWTGNKPLDVVRLVEFQLESGESTWCSPIDKVFMEYSDYKGKTPGNAFKVKREMSDSVGTCLKNAWTTTIHKYQGSEQEIILYAIGDTVDPFSNCQHAYVAVSRATRKVKVLGTKKALTLIASRPPRTRKTTLAMEIKDQNILEVFATVKKKANETRAALTKEAQELQKFLEEVDLDSEEYKFDFPNTSANRMVVDDTHAGDVNNDARITETNTSDSLDSIVSTEDVLYLQKSKEPPSSSSSKHFSLTDEDSRDSYPAVRISPLSSSTESMNDKYGGCDIASSSSSNSRKMSRNALTDHMVEELRMESKRRRENETQGPEVNTLVNTPRRRLVARNYDKFILSCLAAAMEKTNKK